MPGQPLAVYMGDDSRNECIYKFVTAENWATADASTANPIAIGDKYLDRGKLFARAYTDVTNCMMLAALPGQVGDGAKTTLNYNRATGGTLAVDTFVGKTPTTDTLKRFLVGPVGCELTGVTETPDGKALFVNIQHPGETTLQANIGDPSKFTSQWPSNAGFGAGRRPRSATIVITKNDGGRVGS